MKRINISLTILGAIFAFSAAVASSASAGVLFETEVGDFPVAFSGTSKIVEIIETTNGDKVECAEREVKGEVGNTEVETGTKFAHLLLATILFKGCRDNILGGGNCENKGAGSKEIELSSSVAHLGLTHSGTNLHIPAVLLLPNLSTVECSFLGVKGAIKFTGNIIAEIESPEIGVFKSTLTLSFRKEAGKPGVQDYELFLLQLVPESESVMENEHLTAEILGKDEGMSIEGKITFASSKNLRLVEG